MKLSLYTAPVAYVVSCLPPEHPGRRHYTIRVECRDQARELWAVVEPGGYVWGQDSASFDYEPMNSGRTPEWLSSHRFSLTQAMEIAMAQAPLMTVGPGRTVAEALADPFP